RSWRSWPTSRSKWFLRSSAIWSLSSSVLSTSKRKTICGFMRRPTMIVERRPSPAISDVQQSQNRERATQTTFITSFISPKRRPACRRSASKRRHVGVLTINRHIPAAKSALKYHSTFCKSPDHLPLWLISDGSGTELAFQQNTSPWTAGDSPPQVVRKG